jgi:hypothetical protein
MANITLLHGSDHVIKVPRYDLGKETNDYGKGFYCTLLPEMAKEWACKQKNDGFVNKYVLDDSVLKTLNLLDGNYTVLNWIALLLKHRVFTINDEIAQDAKEYIIENYSIDTSTYDVIIGYRADDSYFSYAQSFVHNALPVRCLSKAMQLGKLGVQIVLVSERAFKYLKFVQADPVDKEIYYPKFLARDTQARNDYHRVLKKSKSLKDDLFVMDIMRGEIKNDDSRIQRIVLQ